MHWSKITLTCGMLFLAMIMTGAAQSDSTNREKELGKFYSDSLQSYFKQVYPDTIHIPVNCVPGIKMPTVKFSGPEPVEMPNMPIDGELKFGMPILGEDRRCVDKRILD